jgi:hypothetical protein
MCCNAVSLENPEGDNSLEKARFGVNAAHSRSSPGRRIAAGKARRVTGALSGSGAKAGKENTARNGGFGRLTAGASRGKHGVRRMVDKPRR